MERRCHLRTINNILQEADMTQEDMKTFSSSSIQAYAHPRNKASPVLMIRSTPLTDDESYDTYSDGSCLEIPTSSKMHNRQSLYSLGYRKVYGAGRYIEAVDRHELQRSKERTSSAETKAHALLPEHYTSLSSSGKRRARAKASKTLRPIANIAQGRTPGYRSHNLKHNAAVRTQDEVILRVFGRVIKKIHGTDPYTRCHTCWQSFSCGHAYSTLCRECDSSWDEPDAIERPLYRMILYRTWLPGKFAIFWPSQCSMCPQYARNTCRMEIRVRQFERHLWNRMLRDDILARRLFLFTGYRFTSIKVYTIDQILDEEEDHLLGKISRRFVDIQKLAVTLCIAIRLGYLTRKLRYATPSIGGVKERRSSDASYEDLYPWEELILSHRDFRIVRT